jgi:chloramphenicol-sensitive protein RarD
MNPGVVYAVLAFVMWGLYPLYFRLLASLPPLEVVLHRSVWSLLFVLALLAWLKRWDWLRPLLRQPRQLAIYAASALLIAANWLVYVHAMQTQQVLQASLGYFINPLVSVALGVLVLHERLRPLQWLAVGLASLGVAWLTWRMGGLPWIALALASLFGLYGLVRKTSRLGALEGLAAETMLLAPLAAPWLLWLTLGHTEAMLQGQPMLWFWLLLSGPLTALPLLFFTLAARRLPLASVGVLQYISPSLQFVLGVWVFGEGFDAMRLVGFALIWSALVFYSADALGLRMPKLAP